MVLWWWNSSAFVEERNDKKKDIKGTYNKRQFHVRGSYVR